MAKTFQVLGILGLATWTALGVFAWQSFAGSVQVLVGAPTMTDGVAPLELLQESVDTLQADLRALTAALNASVAQSNGAARTIIEAPRQAPVVSDVSPVPEQLPAPEATTAVEARVEAGKPSFLAFRLPSSDVAFDERREWKILGSLSRVGFDAKSTLHDFSGASTEVEGAFVASLVQPAQQLAGEISLHPASLSTGLGGRDETMLEHLTIEGNERIVFELTGFEDAAVDEDAQTVRGTALGRMTIRGVTRDLSMGVRIAMDKSRRLRIEGEVPIRLTDFEVEVPSQLGVIGMEDELTLWISLVARALPRGSQ